MMISPQGYMSEHENDSFEQLIKESNSLIKGIKDLEKIVFSDDKSDPAWMIHPDPDVQYQMSLEYLAELCKFICDIIGRLFGARLTMKKIRRPQSK